MIIRLTRVEPERVFSGAGLICTKIRSRLGDKTLDSLSFLQSYFLKNDVLQKWYYQNCIGLLIYKV